MSEREYIDSVDRLEQLAPSHALLRWFRANHSSTSELMLETEIEKAEEKKAQKATSQRDRAADDPADDQLQGLRRRQAELFGSRRKESNRLHECRSDAERAAGSESIQSIQRDIEAVMGRIAARKIGSQPSQTVGLPTDALGLHRKIQSLRSSISRKKRDVERLRAMASEKLKSAETKLTELQNDLKNAEKAAVAFREPV